MNEDTNKMGKDETKKETKSMEIRRGNVSISCNSKSPAVYQAQEGISWQGGSVTISGLGSTRAEALQNIEITFNALVKIITGHPIV